ncbi:choice-of-anchor M domain-containing protein [Streptomyces sp. NPDC056165]|uniref:choice-of-anchor M domain-containing protein n=1 Tax=Streptomyces sp. NPDC056165 TaxID=3345733 RepID=UPI0035DE6981
MRTALARHGRAVAVAALTVVSALFVGAAGQAAGGGGPSPAAGAVVLDAGEMDLTPQRVNGKLELLIDDRTGAKPVVRRPDEVVLHAGEATREEVVSPVYPILGELVDAYFLNGYEGAGQVFAPEPGWNGSRAGADTEVRLSGFQGPGQFALYTYTRQMDERDEEPVEHLNSANSPHSSFTLDADQQREVPTWGFTEAGVYRLTFTVTSGSDSDTATLAVVVGDDVDPSKVLPGNGSTPAPTTPAPGPSGGTTTPGVTPSAPLAHVIGNGHLDLAARPIGHTLRFQIKEGGAKSYAWYEPGEVVLHVKPGAKRRIPDGYDFLGPVGAPVWWLPMQQRQGLVWPGWSTEEYTEQDLRGDVTFRLDSVQGPGAVAVFTAGSIGEVNIGLNSGDGLPDSLRHSAHAHSHWNWTFTKEGVYRTTFTVSATLSDGTQVSDTGTLAWAVGDVDPTTVHPGSGGEPTAPPTATPSSSPSSPSPPAGPTGDPTASGSPSASAPGADQSPNTTGSNGGSSTDGGTGTGGTGGSTGGSGGGTTSPTGRLASTGAAVVVAGGLALAALLTGAVTVLAVRRRRRLTAP